MIETNPNEIDDALQLHGRTSSQVRSDEEDKAFQAIEELKMMNLLTNEDFRGFLKELIDRCGIFQQEVRSGGELPIRTGERNIGNWVVDKILRYGPGTLEKILKYKPREKSEEEVKAMINSVGGFRKIEMDTVK